MMDYFREGGWGMWAILITAIATLAITVMRPKEKRVGALVGGCIALLMGGMLGMATGMVAVSRNYAKFPDKTDAVAAGLGELANNGTFAGSLVALFGLAALVLSFMSKEAKPA
jgi:hypothetical protein